MNKNFKFRYWKLVFVGVWIAGTLFFESSTTAQESAPQRPDKIISGPVNENVDYSDKEPTSTNGSERIKQIDRLINQLDSDDETVRIKAGILLQSVATTRDISKIGQLIKQGNAFDKQRFLIRTLGVLADPRASDPLQFEMQYGKKESAVEAIIALGKVRSDWAVPALTQDLLDNAQNNPRRAILDAAALGSIGSNRAVDALQDKLGTIPPSVRISADWALAVAQRKIDPSLLDHEFPEGQSLVRYYKGQRFYLYHPSGRRKSDPRPGLMVCIHDLDLQAEEMFRSCLEMAKGKDFAVLVPFWDPITFPYYQSFNLGFERADKRLIELVDLVSGTVDLKGKEFFLYGRNAGADFVQRFSLAYPNRIARAVALDAQIMEFSSDKLFPLGVAPTAFAPDLTIDLSKAVKSNLLIVYSESGERTRETVTFFRQVAAFENDQQVRGNLSLKAINSKQQYLAEIAGYLFEKNYSIGEIESRRTLKKIVIPR